MALSVEDRLMIMELAARYNHALDHNRADDWADCFTDNGFLRSSGVIRAQGREALVAFVRKAEKEGHKHRRWISNLVIEEAGEKARLLMYVQTLDVSNGIIPYVMGEYDDTLVKVAGKWKFESRNVQICSGKPYMDGGSGKEPDRH